MALQAGGELDVGPPDAERGQHRALRLARAVERRVPPLAFAGRPHRPLGHVVPGDLDGDPRSFRGLDADVDAGDAAVVLDPLVKRPPARVEERHPDDPVPVLGRCLGEHYSGRPVSSCHSDPISVTGGAPCSMSAASSKRSLLGSALRRCVSAITSSSSPPNSARSSSPMTASTFASRGSRGMYLASWRMIVLRGYHAGIGPSFHCLLYFCRISSTSSIGMYSQSRTPNFMR